MSEHTFPRIAYDEIESPFIREEIRTGSFDDREYRRYVNALAYVEWYATDGLSANATGMSVACAGRRNWCIATKYADAFDSVRRDCDAETRAEKPVASGTQLDRETRRQFARRHRAGWAAVKDGREGSDHPTTADTAPADRSTGAGFRFPLLPYTDLQSEFIRDEIRRGAFDDLEFRQYVNRLAYIECWTRKRSRFISGAYPPVRPWIVAAKQPAEYDLIRAELDATTRADLEPIPSVAYENSDLDTRRQRHRAEWRRVQEHSGAD